MLRPGTLHCAFIIKPTIYLERGLYSRSTLGDSIVGTIYSLVDGFGPTDNTHGSVIYCLIGFMDWLQDAPVGAFSAATHAQLAQSIQLPDASQIAIDQSLFFVLGAVAVFAHSLRTDTYRRQDGSFGTLAEIREQVEGFTDEDLRRVQIARIVFVRWILLTVGTKKLHFEGEKVRREEKGATSGSENISLNSAPAYNPRAAPHWVPDRYRAIFCILAHFACVVVVTHMSQPQSAYVERTPLPLIIERLSDDFRDFFGDQAYNHIRMQLYHVSLMRNITDLGLRRDLGDLTSLCLPGVQQQPIAVDVDTWDPPAFELDRDLSPEDDLAEQQAADPDGTLDERRYSRCLFDRSRRIVWKSMLRSGIPLGP